ncbi:hypothetical protein [Thermus tengchongensis]|uniref:hypothetical protein n=1 Tax=Thermus tengchongensis TaxID=1214928 RepID=UPI001F448C15|nr:hypothetical protein [Thermus tengchongensis]
MSQQALTLSGVVAFAGSRHGSPWPVAPVVRLVLASGGAVRVGDQRGVDAAVRLACPSAVVVEASCFPGPPAARLHQRTRAVVLGHPGMGLPPASALLVFPRRGRSRLGARLLPGPPPGRGGGSPGVGGRGAPPFRAGVGPLSLAGVPGWVLYPVQSTLF